MLSFLNSFYINLVIFRMGSDKTDNHPSCKKYNYGNNPIIISFDIKYISAIANIISRKKVIF